jgi:hypothetical protein
VQNQIETSAEFAEEAILRTGKPRAGAVHADPVQCGTVETDPLPEAVARIPVEKKSAAEWAYERLLLYIQNFEAQLDSAHEVAMGFTGGQTGTLQIEGVGFYDPDIVTFYGRDEDGLRTQLIQHVSQLNVMLRAVPKAENTEEPRRIGFRLIEQWSGGDAGDASV